MIIQPAGLRNAPECWEMYAFADGQWQRIRRLEPEYEIDEVGFHRPVGYREIFYQDGEVQEERALEEMGSIWLDNEHTMDLHTFGREWTGISAAIGGETIEKEVRRAGRTPGQMQYDPEIIDYDPEDTIYRPSIQPDNR